MPVSGEQLKQFPSATATQDADLIYTSQSGIEAATPAGQLAAYVNAKVNPSNLPARNTLTGAEKLAILQSGALVEATVNDLTITNATRETFVAGTDFTPGVTTAITLAGTYGSINNIGVYFDAAPQFDCTLSGKVLSFTPVVPGGIGEVIVVGGAARTIGTPSAGTVVDASIAPGSKASNRISLVKFADDFGTPSAATIASAVSAIQASGGGILYVPNVAFTAYALPTSYAGVLLEYDGPNVPGTQGGEAYGTNFIAQKILRYQDNVAHLGFAHSVLHIENKPIGTGQIGPNNADFGASISLLKQNFSGVCSAGELDGMNIIVRNGGSNSDTTGFLINVANYGVGFNAAFESNTTAISGGAVTKQIDFQAGVVDTRSGFEYGVVIGAGAGADLHTAALFQGGGGSAYWTNFLLCQRDSVTTFTIDGIGRIRMRDANGLNIQSEIVMAVGNGILNVSNDGATSSIMTLDQTGNLTLGGYANSTAYKVSAIQVVGAQISGYGTPTGQSRLASFPGASATLVQCSAQIAQIITDLKTHGLLAS